MALACESIRFSFALRRWGRFARRNVCDSATKIPYWWRKISHRKVWIIWTFCISYKNLNSTAAGLAQFSSRALDCRAGGRGLDLRGPRLILWVLKLNWEMVTNKRSKVDKGSLSSLNKPLMNDHRRASALLSNIRNIRIFMGKKPISLRTADVSPRSSPMRDVSRGGTSATQRQKFHTDDEKSVQNPVVSLFWLLFTNGRQKTKGCKRQM